MYVVRANTRFNDTHYGILLFISETLFMDCASLIDAVIVCGWSQVLLKYLLIFIICVRGQSLGKVHKKDPYREGPVFLTSPGLYYVRGRSLGKVHKLLIENGLCYL